MPLLPYRNSDPANSDFQYLEDLATGYWYSEVLFTALSIGLFDHIEAGPDTEGLSVLSGCARKPLERLLVALLRLELVGTADGRWYNSQIARQFLLKNSGTYLGDFLLYRRYMQPGWQALANKVMEAENLRPRIGICSEDDYETRNFHYVRATDTLLREKVADIRRLIAPTRWQGPVLDIGGGSGSLCRALLIDRPEETGIVFDLPEVLRAAETLYPDFALWDRITRLPGDFRTHGFEGLPPFGLIVLSNFLHAYGPKDARELLEKAVRLLNDQGIIVVHDYFPDRLGRVPEKGALYDLAMMANTYQGTCHQAAHVEKWLKASGLTEIETADLSTDSSIILAGNRPDLSLCIKPADRIAQIARRAGFRSASLLPANRVKLAPWARTKCRFGCAEYGKGLMCPPHGIPTDEMRSIRDSYESALVVEDTPPGKQFHTRLIDLERRLFLAGFYKALGFGAGPCPVCDPCPGEGPCRFPEKARPSMEGSGIDVYETARRADIPITPVSEQGRYVKYIGLVFVE